MSLDQKDCKNRILFEIVVVDDEPDISECHKDWLVSCGYNVKNFTSPVDVIKYVDVNRDRVSLIVTDYNMPVLTGLEMMSEVQKVKGIPYILITGGISDHECSSDKDKIGHLSKPCDYDELTSLLVQFFGQKAG